jgi:hypothetical protein
MGRGWIPWRGRQGAGVYTPSYEVEMRREGFVTMKEILRIEGGGGDETLDNEPVDRGKVHIASGWLGVDATRQ